MIPVNIVSVAGSLGVLFFYFRRRIPVSYDVSQLKTPRETIRDLATFRAGIARGHVIDTRKVIFEAPWQIVIFSLSMYLVVYGLRNEGLTGYITGLLDIFAGYGVWGQRLALVFWSPFYRPS